MALSRQTGKLMRGSRSAGGSLQGGVKGRLEMMIVGLAEVLVKQYHTLAVVAIHFETYRVFETYRAIQTSL